MLAPNAFCPKSLVNFRSHRESDREVGIHLHDNKSPTIEVFRAAPTHVGPSPSEPLRIRMGLVSASLPVCQPASLRRSHGIERPTVDVANGPIEVQDLDRHQLVRHSISALPLSAGRRSSTMVMMQVSTMWQSVI